MLLEFNRGIIVILALIYTIEITISFKIKNHIHKRSNEDEDIDEILRGNIFISILISIYTYIK